MENAAATRTPFESRLRAALPPGWYAKESLTLTAPAANVIFSSEPLEPTFATQDYAAQQGTILRTEFDGYHEIAFYPDLVFGGRPGFVREFEWAPKDGAPITQIQHYYTTPGRGYTATATTETRNFEAQEAVLRDVLVSLSIAAG